MEYKGLLLDLDNTLYEYLPSHTQALDVMIEVCHKKCDVSIEEIKIAYTTARYRVHLELRETAASHNRLLYIQKMLELLNINPLKYGFELYNSYWDTFLNKIKLFDGVSEFLEKYKGKICIVSDLTAHIQYRKINKLELEQYIDCLVSSEEAGKEKPHPYPFMIGLHKLDLKPQDVCMIGDSFKKDIVGATNLGIKSFWINQEKNIEKIDKNLVTDLRSFEEILEYL
jgi:HAD superfamily hydrolase (TIGR01549 family)